MTTARRRDALRRLVAALAILFLIGPASVAIQSANSAEAGTRSSVPSTVIQPKNAADAGTGSSTTYDVRLSRSDCALLGRKFTRGHGCSRTDCVKRAVPFRRSIGAEACALRGQPSGYGFVSTIDARQCTALLRLWIPDVNYCASMPDRSATVVYNAPQCLTTGLVYVNLLEEEGYYDECLTPQRADELTQRAAADGATLTDETSLRSSTQCPHRPRHVYVDDACVLDPNAQPAGGGVVMIGDSLTWRGGDELARRHREFTLDGEPARKLTALKERLDFFRAGHGQPDGLIIELGTSPAPSFRSRDLVRIVKSVPASTTVMLVQPYYEIGTDPVVVTESSTRVARWMAALAKSRPDTCVANWPAYVRAHPGTLLDGAHTTHAAEGGWARWISQQWRHC